MRAVRSCYEFAIGALGLVAVILLVQEKHHGAPRATAVEAAHDPRSCNTCLQPLARINPIPIPGTELVAPAPRLPEVDEASSDADGPILVGARDDAPGVRAGW